MALCRRADRPGAFLRPALARGHRFGFIASADAHDGHPGNAQSPLVKHHHQIHFLGSGRVVHAVQPYEDETELQFEWVDPAAAPWAAEDAVAGPRGSCAYYYVKVIQQDGEMAWASPIWIDS